MSEKTQYPEEKLNLVPIQRALLSLSDKNGLPELADYLTSQGIELISTGGTAKFLRQLGHSVTEVASLTGFPEIMDGRVKTLHPAIHGGILANRDQQSHQASLIEHGIQPIDLVVISLYPFAQTIANSQIYEDCVEEIDIGGPAMIRAAAKNHRFVTILTSPKHYSEFIQVYQQNQGATNMQWRSYWAQQAFILTSQYDRLIGDWLAQNGGERPSADGPNSDSVKTDNLHKDQFPLQLNWQLRREAILRYGENPHQAAALYKLDTNGFVNFDKTTLLQAQIIQGKALSYNNYHDAGAAFELISEFDKPTAVIIKHANPCGVAIAESLIGAWHKALDADPVSAFGGVVAFNRQLDAALARELTAMFLELVIAPSLDHEAKEILKNKPNLRVLITGTWTEQHQDEDRSWHYRSIGPDAILIQERDFGELSLPLPASATTRKICRGEEQDLIYAHKICKHVKSNAIVIVANGQTLGIGAGQMSRLDAAKLAVQRMDLCRNLDKASLTHLVAASDAFFPFPDALDVLVKAGVKSVIHAGGSIQDSSVTAFAEEAGISLILSGQRNFRH